MRIRLGWAIPTAHRLREPQRGLSRDLRDHLTVNGCGTGEWVPSSTFNSYWRTFDIVDVTTEGLLA